jgi:membrane-associated phospholipid phosphatase
MWMAFLGSAAAIIARHSNAVGVKVIVTLSCVFLILRVGISRIYVGTPWADDVVGAAGYSADASWRYLTWTRNSETK